jgi:hypothetical protein
VSHHLAQVNIARTLAPFGDEAMAGLVNRIVEINALAEGSPGFVWRYQPPEEGSHWFAPFEDYFVPFDPARFFFNMSIWESLEHLQHYIHRTAHVELLREKAQWMAEFDKAALALWWIRVGQIPSVLEARARLAAIDERGPTVEAFNLARRFPRPTK